MADLLDIPDFLRREPGGLPDDVAVTDFEEADVSPEATLPDDVRWQPVYYMMGSAPKHFRHRYWAKNPPHLGMSHAFVIGAEDARKLTIFCPYHFWSEQVRPDAGELAYEPAALTEDGLGRLKRIMLDNWDTFVRIGLQRDYDVAALVLTRLEVEVPKTSLADAEAKEGRPAVERKERRGGKPHAPELIKSVDRDTKRGAVAEFFLGSEQKSIRECMARLSMSRNSVLSALNVLNKAHGLGYETHNDTASILIPIDWDIWK